MRTGQQRCYTCGTRITYEVGEMVDSMPADEPCLGCLRLLPILEESARKRSAMPPEPAPETAMTPSAIYERIRPKRQAPRDWAMAAAGDHE